MKKLALISALLLAASPAAAQLATSSRVQQLNGHASLRHRSADPIAATEGSNLLVEVDLALDLK